MNHKGWFHTSNLNSDHGIANDNSLHKRQDGHIILKGNRNWKDKQINVINNFSTMFESIKMRNMKIN